MKKKFILAGIATILLVILDQYTKRLVVDSIALNQHIDLIPKLLYLTYLQNTGAAFSMMEGSGNIFFGVITIVAMVFIIYMFKESKKLHYDIGYVLVFAGAIGNFIDRMTLNFVRDFIGVYIGSYPFPIFNVADICITVGFGLVLLFMLYEEVEEKRRWKKELSK